LAKQAKSVQEVPTTANPSVWPPGETLGDNPGDENEPTNWTNRRIQC